ncbi:MAG: RagB/SusD family nutrient uptake outer membrane protein, partial [Chitinophagaceae bacterium]|nr:RagB/SusD family nutrient uptake outer membrane protein [Chitinophagaceae bacterium]
MKYFLKSSIYGLLFLVFIPSCSVLDRDPVDRYSDAVVWSDINLADNYLKTAYRNMFHGYFGALFFDCYSDINYFKFDRGTAVWLKDNVTPDNLGALSDNTRTPDVNWSLWNNIQRLNIFISRIDGIHEYYPSTQQDGIKERAAVLKGEALFLRAECYTRLCRLWGGLPVRNEPWTLGEDFYIERNSFEETVNAIVEDCNEAASLLKGKSETTPGRASRGAALALKSRKYCFLRQATLQR